MADKLNLSLDEIVKQEREQRKKNKQGKQGKQGQNKQGGKGRARGKGGNQGKPNKNLKMRQRLGPKNAPSAREKAKLLRRNKVRMSGKILIDYFAN